MSLINDALKRAKAAQQATAHGPALHFRPVEVPAQTRRSFGLPQVAIVGLLLLIGLLVLKSIHQKNHVTAAAESPARAASAARTEEPAPQPSVAPPATATAPAPEPAHAIQTAAPSTQAALASEPKSEPSPAVETVAAQPEPAQPAPQVAAPAPAPEPPKAVLPRLQGIFFDPSRPSAMINGKTLFVGDKTGGFRVIAIDQQSATLANDGQTNTLTLDQ